MFAIVYNAFSSSLSTIHRFLKTDFLESRYVLHDMVEVTSQNKLRHGRLARDMYPVFWRGIYPGFVSKEGLIKRMIESTSKQVKLFF